MADIRLYWFAYKNGLLMVLLWFHDFLQLLKQSPGPVGYLHQVTTMM